MRIVLCGSMSASANVIEVSKELQNKGHDVIVPENIAEHAKGQNLLESKDEKITFNVFKNYFHEIEQADAVLIVNTEKNGQKNYIGPNTLIEMAFAHVLDKPIYILHEIPDCSYSDELYAMHPIALHGDIKILPLA